MQTDYKNLFTHLQTPEPSANLLNKVLRRIEREQRLRAKQRIAIFFVIFLASAIALTPAFEATRTEFMRSGFFNLLSLLFSDPNIIASLWNQFIFSILESAPVINIAILLLTVLLFLISLKYLVRDAILVFTRIKFSRN